MFKLASSLRTVFKNSSTRCSRLSSSLCFNGFDRTLEPGTTYRHPCLGDIELKIEENPSLVNTNNPFSIYIPEMFNNPLNDAYRTKLDLVQWSSQFHCDKFKSNYSFLVSETPGSVITPGGNYEMQLLSHMQWYWVFTMDDVMERLSMSRDQNTKLLTVALFSNIRDLCTGRDPLHDLRHLPIECESDLQIAIKVEQLTRSMVENFEKVLPLPILRHWFAASNSFFASMCKEIVYHSKEREKISIDDVLATRQNSIGLASTVAPLLTIKESEYLPPWSQLLELTSAICVLDNCYTSYAKESKIDAAVLNSVQVLIRTRKMSTEHAVAHVISKRNKLMKSLVSVYKRTLEPSSKSAMWKLGSVLVGVWSVQINGRSRYGWINQRHPLIGSPFDITNPKDDQMLKDKKRAA